MKLTDFKLAAEKNDPSLADRLNKEGIDEGINAYLEDGSTALIIACSENLLDIAKDLIGKDADVKHAAQDGNTALHFVAKHGNKDLYDFMVSKGASATAPNKIGQTPEDFLSARQSLENIDDAVIQQFFREFVKLNVKTIINGQEWQWDAESLEGSYSRSQERAFLAPFFLTLKKSVKSEVVPINIIKDCQFSELDKAVIPIAEICLKYGDDAMSPLVQRLSSTSSNAVVDIYANEDHTQATLTVTGKLVVIDESGSPSDYTADNLISQTFQIYADPTGEGSKLLNRFDEREFQSVINKLLVKKITDDSIQILTSSFSENLQFPQQKELSGVILKELKGALTDIEARGRELILKRESMQELSQNIAVVLKGCVNFNKKGSLFFGSKQDTLTLKKEFQQDLKLDNPKIFGNIGACLKEFDSLADSPAMRR